MIATRSLALTVTGVVALLSVACSSAAMPAEPAAATKSPTATQPTSTSVPAKSTVTTEPSTPTPAPTVQGTVKVPPLALPIFVENDDCQSVSRAQLSRGGATLADGAISVVIAMEIARSQAEQSQGLMCRSSVPEGSGMLFAWDEDRTGGFWMFNTYVPLDIIFFGGESGEVAIRQMAPCPRSEGEDDSTWGSRCSQESVQYRTSISYRFALELPQGWLESTGFDTDNPDRIDVSLLIGA